jgi:hypothetical protein
MAASAAAEDVVPLHGENLGDRNNQLWHDICLLAHICANDTDAALPAEVSQRCDLARAQYELEKYSTAHNTLWDAHEIRDAALNEFK